MVCQTFFLRMFLVWRQGGWVELECADVQEDEAASWDCSKHARFPFCFPIDLVVTRERMSPALSGRHLSSLFDSRLVRSFRANRDPLTQNFPWDSDLLVPDHSWLHNQKQL